MKYLVVVLIALLSGGCAMWPEEGHGGWAENFHYENEAPSIWYSQSQGLLQHDYDHLSLRLQVMRARGIRQCMPAQLKLATLMQNRIQRQLVAGMFSQSQHDLTVFYHQVNLLQTHFDDVNHKTGCAGFAVNESLQLDAKTAALDLLNSDNQFAFADDNLTPKYTLRIQKAAELLKLFDHVDLLLIGHTDNIGSETSNIDLGLRRAKHVAAALREAGVENATISAVSNGEFAPFSDETTVAARLSNRRVVAYVLSAQGEPMSSSRNDQYSQSANIPLLYWTQSLLGNGGKAQ